MSRRKLIERTVRKLIQVAGIEGYVIKSIFDSEETIRITSEDSSQHIISMATGTDFARIKFINQTGDAFFVYLAYDNQPSEMIYDHTDCHIADMICRQVHDHFEGLGL